MRPKPELVCELATDFRGFIVRHLSTQLTLEVPVTFPRTEVSWSRDLRRACAQAPWGFTSAIKRLEFPKLGEVLQ